MKKKVLKIIVVFLLLLSCGKDGTSEIAIDEEVKVTSVKITSESQDLLKGTTVKLFATISPSNATNKTVVWSSSDEAIAIVDSTGMVTGLAIGEATIEIVSEENPSISATIGISITGETSNEIASFIINEIQGVINGNNITFEFYEGTDVSALNPIITHTGVSISPEDGEEKDFSSPVTYYVSSENGDIQEYQVTIVFYPLPISGPEFITIWKTDNPGASNDDQITIPTFDGETYNYSVDWGDGNVDNGISGDITHTYDSPGTYKVIITGDFPGINFYDTSVDVTNKDNLKILAVEQWGDIRWTAMAFAFMNCENLDVTATDTPNLSGVTSLTSMFVGAKSLVYNSTINNWETSSITNMQQLFSGALKFNQPIGNWDLSNVSTTARMFQSAISFNQNIGNWNMSNVRNMQSMFIHAKSFKKDISSWDVGSVTTMGGLFWGTPFNQDIGDWDVSNVTDMYGMFVDNEVFNQDIGGWNVARVTNMGNMFVNASSFNQDIGDWEVSNVDIMFSMFKNASTFDQNLSEWNISNVANMEDMFLGVELSKENYDATLIGWNNLPSLQNGIEFGGGSSQYCLSETARQNLIDTYSWTIIDGGQNCD